MNFLSTKYVTVSGVRLRNKVYSEQQKLINEVIKFKISQKKRLVVKIIMDHQSQHIMTLVFPNGHANIYHTCMNEIRKINH
jgi:hypothetical protein